ncbi:hypothetical protein ES319_D08G220700v1 [Gossypium barbadense]|uniref:Peptidase M1 leukotriene A4 hydrolase/aminopeptidase C-terminal domain-containing protein n=1 Tax=Gossypium barbadense TaxID=3634 RepID=A0A5J5QJA6_GOSBA|nr:hypothetical protein ES319_D08G220700v1 [Gossypium barbadense]
MNTPEEIFLKDYKSPDYYFDTVDLNFSLGEEKTIVASKITVFPRVEGSPSPLILDGVVLKLISVKVNGKELKEGAYMKHPLPNTVAGVEHEALLHYILDSCHLKLPSLPGNKFTLEIDTEIQPQNNTLLEGLYKSSGNFCTQCESEGFRKITFYQGGKHYVVWEDPFKKPSYLFALVAGQLESRDDIFVTRSGQKVSLRIWTPAQDVPKTAHAMYSLKAAKKWDEDRSIYPSFSFLVFGLEYDLDLFNIVAVPDFNIYYAAFISFITNMICFPLFYIFSNNFNSKLVLASPETATDTNYAAILGVISHEYFHNWTGNRVTCRDWFQLSSKEGLTVFRDHEFSSDVGSRKVKRIADMTCLCFCIARDAGPMAHPVRPHSYIKMDNFYTGKFLLYLIEMFMKRFDYLNPYLSCLHVFGAEVVRMYKTLLGTQGFRKGMDLCFKRHDGQAVTCEDFFSAMRDTNDADFANFLLWYSQAGTLVVKVTSSYNTDADTFSLKFSQEVPPTPGQPVKEPMFIPVAVGLLDSSGRDIPLSSVYHNGTLRSVACNNQPVLNTVLRVTKAAIMSVAYLYSAPIRLESDLTDNDLFFLLAHDSDEFNRFEAGQLLARKLMLSLVAVFQQNKPLALNPRFVQGLRSILCDTGLDKECIAKAITLPGEGEIMDMMEVADLDAVHAVQTFIRKEIASQLKSEFLNTVKNNRSSDEFVFNHPKMAQYALKNVALDIKELALHEYKAATNMTEQFAALAAITQKPGKTCNHVLTDLYNKWQHDFLVVNKWFALQAMSDIPGNVENVRNLLTHPAFDLRSPTKVYSLIGGFFIGEIVLQLDKLNPRVASRMVSAFSRWRRFDESRQKLAKAQLEKIMSVNGLSENIFKIASKSLSAALN